MLSSGTPACSTEFREAEDGPASRCIRRRVTSGDRLKVLIVDDDACIAEMYRLRLEIEGYEVIVATDGEQGLALARATAPGFICLDYRLPGIDGLEALGRLRAQPATSSIPVLMLSNDSDPAIRERGLRLGALHVGIKAEMTPGQLAEFIARRAGPMRARTGVDVEAVEPPAHNADLASTSSA